MFVKLTNIIRFSALAILMLSCSLHLSAQSCDAEAGSLNDIRYVVCDGDPFQVGGVDFNSSSDYSQVYILTAPDRTVVAVSNDGAFGVLPTGEYRINPVNYANDDAPDLPAVGENFSDLIAQTGASCFDLTTDSVGVLFLNPIELTGEAFCDPEVGGSYFIRIFVTGGFPEYADKGSYNLNFAPNSVQWDPDNDYATGVVGPIPATVEGFSIDVLNDGNLCSGGPFRVERGGLEVPCDEPDPGPQACIPAEPGTMPSETVFSCDGGTVSAQTSGEVLGENDLLIYALHTNAGTQAGDILAINETGTFSMDDASLATNTAYYISAVAGRDFDGDLIPDLDTICTQVAAGTPIVFLDPIEVTHAPECNDVTGEFMVVVTVKGGLPEYDGSLYNIIGLLNDQVGKLVALGPVPSGQDYSFTISDGICEQVEIQGEVVSCKKEADCCTESSPGNMSGETMYSCEGGAITATASNSSLGDDNCSFMYVLHSGDGGTIGTVFGTNTTGTFSLEDIDGGSMNTVYYVSSVVGPDEDGDGLPDLDNDCTVSSERMKTSAPGTPIVFLTPLEVDFTMECLGVVEQVFVVNLSVSGGLPAFDGSNYQLGGTFNDNISGGITLGPLSTGENFQIVITDDAGCTYSVDGPTVTCKPSPIECASFTGEVLTEGNFLKWTSATEIDNDFYTVAHSTDGENFETIATIDGAGTSLEAINYSYMDKAALSGTSYYRVSQTDFNGTSAQACDVVTLTRGESTFGFVNVSPMPAITVVDVIFNSDIAADAQVNVFDITGQKVGTQNTKMQAGLNNIEIDMSDYATGIYLVSISNGTSEITTKVVKN